MQMTNTTKTQMPLPFRLTNDYLFRAVFQTKQKALEGLCRSVLHLPKEDSVTVTLRNPVELGRSIENKEFILDLAVTVNDSVYLNLEMQMYKDIYWIERSISYILLYTISTRTIVYLSISISFSIFIVTAYFLMFLS
ncbi:MAG: Rpn family recombination-promoting nuclease/putative transposase [Clostridium sp.]|nr:Rpn family recombination-promoting nuclease/putative transposase [Clostridium sp.]